MVREKEIYVRIPPLCIENDLPFIDEEEEEKEKENGVE